MIQITQDNLNLINNRSIVGVQYSETNDKGFVTLGQDNNYIGYVPHETDTRTDDKWYAESKQSYAYKVIEDGGSVYLFDDFLELFRWLQDERIKQLETALKKMCEYHEVQGTWDKGDNGYYAAKIIISP